MPNCHDKYLVSNYGNVYSVPRPSTRGGLLAQNINSTGYLTVNLWIDGRHKTALVHQLVAAAFLGTRPEGLETRHLDGNRLTNGLWNLAYGTRAENRQDMAAHGTNYFTNKTHCPQGHE